MQVTEMRITEMRVIARDIRRAVRVGTVWIGLLAVLPLLTRCDSVEPGDPDLLVVQGFLETDRPPGPIVLRRTMPLQAPSGRDRVADADIRLTLDGRSLTYRPSPDESGVYEPVGAALEPVRARAPFEVELHWNDRIATARGFIPPPIALDSLQVDAPATPIEAILVDSLRLDTLDIPGARQGYIYPVEVTLWWTANLDETSADSAYWIETQLAPTLGRVPTVLDFSQLTGQILRERTMPRDGLNRRSWTGVYAVPVATPDAPLPAHALRVMLIRSGEDYARFAASLDAPERREPVSNLDGALGIFAGIALDSLRLHVAPPVP